MIIEIILCRRDYMKESKNEISERITFKVCLFWITTIIFVVPAICSCVIIQILSFFSIGNQFLSRVLVFPSLPIVAIFVYAKCATKIMKGIRCSNELYLLYIFTFLMYLFAFLFDRFYKI